MKKGINQNLILTFFLTLGFVACLINSSTRLPAIFYLIVLGISFQRKKNPAFTWMIRDKYFLILVGITGLIYVALITQGNMNLWERQTYGELFDLSAERLAKGHIDITSMHFEGYYRGGRIFTYFGIFPTLLRVVGNIFYPQSPGGWSRIFTWAAGFLSLWFFCTLAANQIFRNPSMSPRLKKFVFYLTFLAFAFGGPLFYFMSSATIYHESIIESVLWMLVALNALLKIMTDPIPRPTTFFVLCGATACIILCRVPTGVPFAAFAGIILLTAFYRFFFKTNPAESRLDRRRLYWLIIAFVPLIFVAQFQAWYNNARFGSAFTFQPLNLYFPFMNLPAASVPHIFDWERLPSALQTYWGIESKYFMWHFPYFIMGDAYTYSAGTLPWDLAIPLTLSFPWGIFLALAGILLFLRRPRKKMALFVMLVFLVCPTMTTMLYYHQSERYVADFLPLLLFPGMYFLGEWNFPKQKMRLTRVMGISILLVGFSIAATVGSTLWNVPNQVTLSSEKRENFKRWLENIDDKIRAFLLLS